MNYFPSANLSYRLGESRRLRLSYSRRVNRPGLSVLNPIDRSTDPLRRRVGNLNVEPEFTHSLSFDLSQDLGGGNIRLSPYVQATRNGWSEITTVDASGVSTETYQNIASSDSYGLGLSYSLRRRDGWGGNISISARRETRDASNLDDRYSGSFLRFSSRANVNARLTEDLSAEANLRYSPPTDLPQGRRDASYAADLGLRYRMLDGRGSIRLALQDPFGLAGSRRQLRDVDYIQIGRSEASTTSARLNFSYSLGGGGRFRGGGRRR